MLIRLQVEPCCWSTYSIHRDTQATLAILDELDVEGEKLSDEEIARLFGFEDEYNRGTLTRWQKVRPRIWALFDEPYSSTAAKCIACISILFICLSVLCFCLKSHTMTKQPRNNQRQGEPVRSESGRNRDDVDSYPVFFYLEHACNAWFTLEITLRCLVRTKLPLLLPRHDAPIFMVRQFETTCLKAVDHLAGCIDCSLYSSMKVIGRLHVAVFQRSHSIRVGI